MQKSCSLHSKACRVACISFITTVASAVFVASVAAAATNHDSTVRIIGEPCRAQTRCNWNILPIPETGCCPRELGQTCHPETQEFCNSELGLVCVDRENNSRTTEDFGICRGPYNLTSTIIAQEQVTLEWIHFAPKDYPFEYALLLRKDTYHRDLSQWDIRDCGAQPMCVMRRLSPGTTYLVKMAVWSDIRAMTFGTTTETIVVTTKPVAYCESGQDHYPVGESFIDEGQENCTCLPTGEIKCHPLCPDVIPEMEEGCQAFLGEGCQYSVKCNLTKGFDESEEGICKRYPDGTELRFDCRVCRCAEEKLKCSYSEVCSVLSPKPSCTNIKEIKIPGQCCPLWDCEDVCEHENKSYSAGELFQSKSCGLCQCNSTGKVECVSKCPPVEMVPASPACPDPHIKRSGCCDTLHCFKAESDLFSYVHNLAVLYTTSISLTLSFPVEPLCETNGDPTYCYYKIQYVNTSTSQGSHGWKNRIVHPADVVHDELLANYPHPIDVLTRDTAIVINGRAVVTLTGLYPSTEFYVVVTRVKEVRDDMLEIDSSVASLTAKVVVKTRPLQNVTSCFYSGREVLHGEIVSRSCNQMCICQLGQIVCQSTCRDENIVVASSPSCPKPSLEKREGECCPKWHCKPSVSGCQYNNALLRPGQVISDGCQECVCSNGAVRCQSLCPSTGASPRNGCVLGNHTGHCCPQWSCPLERTTPIAVESSVLLTFHGSCPLTVIDFKKILAVKMMDYISNLMNCSSSLALTNLCDGINAKVECNRKFQQEVGREKRSTMEEEEEEERNDFFNVLFSVRRNYSSEKDQEIVYKAGQDLQALLKSNFSIRLPSGHTFHSSPEIKLTRPVFICRLGFYYKNGQCIVTEIDNFGSHLTHVTVTPVDIRSQSVAFQWPPLGDIAQNEITSLHLKYRPKGVLTWTSAMTLPSWRTSCSLTGLTPGTTYEGALVAIGYDGVGNEDVDGEDYDANDTENGNTLTWTLGDTSFQTLFSSEDEGSSSIVLTEVSVTANAIVLYWGHLTQEFWKQVEVASILYWASNSNEIHKIRLENNGFPFTKLGGLSSSTEYTSQMTIVLSDGQTARSQRIQLRTLPSENCDYSLLMKVLLPACGVVFVALIILLILMCRRNQKRKNNTSIENKLYGITLENNTGSSNPVRPPS